MPQVPYGDRTLPSCAAQLARLLARGDPAFVPGESLLCNTEWDPSVSPRRRAVALFDAAGPADGPLKTLSSGPSCERSYVSVVSFGGTPEENAEALARAVNGLCAWRDELLEGFGTRTLLLHVGAAGGPRRHGRTAGGDEAWSQALAALRRPVTPRDPGWPA